MMTFGIWRGWKPFKSRRRKSKSMASSPPLRSSLQSASKYSLRSAPVNLKAYRSGGCSVESISGGGEVVSAFFWLVEIANVPDLLPESIDGSGGLCAQMSFKLCEGHLDGIEIGTVGRQEQDPGAPCLNCLLRGLALMGRQIIHDDDIAFFEGWGELFLNVSLEDAPVHRGVDDEGRGQPVAARAGHEGLGHPMAERRLCAQPLSLEGAAAQTGHFGCGSGLVEKDEPMRLKPHARLARGDPFFARRFDIGAILLACQQRFF